MWKKGNIIYLIALLFIFVLSSCTPAPPWNPETNTRRRTQQRQPRPETKQSSHLSPKKQELLATIKQYLGVPYKWGGVDKSGMDCSGLVITIYRDVFDMALPHNSSQLSKLGTRINRHKLTLGDLVFFRTGNGPQISHVGIYLADSHFVHASSSSGVTISNMATNSYYVHRFVSGRRMLKL